MELPNMIKCKASILSLFPRIKGRILSRNPSKDKHIHQGVPPQSIFAMYPSSPLPRSVKAWDTGLSSIIELQASILVVKGRIDENRLLRNINSISFEKLIFTHKFLDQRSFSVEEVNHWGIQPYAHSSC